MRKSIKTHAIFPPTYNIMCSTYPHNILQNLEENNENKVNDSKDKEIKTRKPNVENSNEMAYELHVETMKEEATSKLVCEDAEELFPTTEMHIKPQTMNDTGLGVKNIGPVYDKHQGHANPTFH